MKVEESYSPIPFAADVDGLLVSIAGGGVIGGYLCTTSGSIKLTKDSGAGATLVDTMAVTAGVFYPIPMAAPPGMGVYVTQTGGAAGTFFANL